MTSGGAKQVHLPVSRLMDGYLATQLLCVAAKLKLADALAEGLQGAEALARQCGVDAAMLRRVLRGLAAEGVVDELGDGRFALAEGGQCLRSGVPGSLRSAIIARGELYYGAAGGLFDALSEGAVPFERAYGDSFFDYMTRNPEAGAVFQGSQENRAGNEAGAVAAAYDFGRFSRLVDVGGGHGVMLAAILRTAPALTATLFDLPPVVARARERLKDLGLGERCEFVAGDFAETVPPGGDAYLLSRILHDWDDEAALRILRRCRAAMAPGSILLLVEVVLPERAADAAEAIRMDLHMLILFRGRERTAAEFERLLAEAGFKLVRILPTGSPSGVAVIEAIAPGG